MALRALLLQAITFAALWRGSLSLHRRSPVGEPLAAIEGLVTRLLGQEWVERFSYVVVPPDASGMDVFEVDADPLSQKPVLRGNNGVSLASALNFYLKYVAGCSVSWGWRGTGDQLNLSQPLPLPAGQTRVVSPVKYR